MVRTIRTNGAALAIASVLSVAVATASSAPAVADPPPAPAPAEPAPAPNAPPVGLVPPPGALQSFLPEGALAPGSGYDFLLGQTSEPAAPGVEPGQPQQPMFLDPNAIQALRPINFGLAGQGQQSIYSYTPAASDAPTGGLLDNIRGARGLFHYPMGKLDMDQLGQPLPGIAPPPGTNIPVGLNWPEAPPAAELPPPPPPGE